MGEERGEVKRASKVGGKKKVVTGLPPIHLNGAGIDVGATEHWVAVPEGSAEPAVRRFEAFTSDLQQMADWLKECGVETVAMESTGVYWIPLFQILEKAGFEVLLVNARTIKNVTGRKSDVSDCQWIQQLHTFGLLSGSFRPEDQVCVLRSYLRHRDNLIKQASLHIQHMQKALNQMNLQLHHVISDITGRTGQAIVDAILSGERDARRLAGLRDPRIKSSADTIIRALQGDYRAEHLFVLRQALESFRFCQSQIRECDQALEQSLQGWDSKVDLSQTPAPPRKRTKRSRDNEPAFDLHGHLYRITGVDATAIDGLNAYTVQIILSETGLDMTRWPTEKHFASWLGLCPDHRISGGKILKRKTRHVVNRAAGAFRMAAWTLARSQSALGAFYRRMRSRLGAPKAIEATAHKISRLFYRLIRFGHSYVDQGAHYYEEKYRERLIRNLGKQAKTLGFQLVELSPALGEVS